MIAWGVLRLRPLYLVQPWRDFTDDERQQYDIPELTCDQRALYRLEPLCDANDVLPTPSSG